MQALELEDVAALLGVSERMVRNYIKDNDLPCRGDGRGRRFTWPEVLEWYVSYRVTLVGNRRSVSNALTEKDPKKIALAQAIEYLRRTTAEADRLELKLAQERGEVVAVGDVEQSIAKVATSLKAAILGLPAKLVTRLYGVKDRGAMRAILDGEARELCSKLAMIGKESAPKHEVSDVEL